MESSGTFHSDLKAAVLEKDAGMNELLRRPSDAQDATQDECFKTLRLAVMDYIISRISESRTKKIGMPREQVRDNVVDMYRKKLLQLIIDM